MALLSTINAKKERKAGYIEFMMLCTRGVIMKKMGRISIMAVEVL